VDDSDLQLLRLAQSGVPITSQPYLAWAKTLGWSEEEVIRRLSDLEKEGIIRRFAATIGHRALGILANAMIAWQVPDSDVETVGLIFASFEEVTHCYERFTGPNWPYNLYTMVHSRSRDDCIKIALRLSQASGMNEYRILFSEKEYKKTSARI
jgi:DNA-binding Lrp family transcriptional regulator